MTKKQIIDTSDLSAYLQGASPSSYMSKGNSPLSFHWSDWKETCEFMTDSAFSEHKLEEWKMGLGGALDQLRHIPVWLKNRLDQVQVSLFDVYSAYMDPKLMSVWFDQKRDQILISTVSDAGPFIPLGSMRWFVKDLYLNFVYLRLLEKKLPQREFRLRFEDAIQCDFVYNTFLVEEKVNLQQFTKRGILLRFSQVQMKEKLENLERINLYFNDKYFSQIQADTEKEHFAQFSSRAKRIFSKHQKAAFYTLNRERLKELLDRTSHAPQIEYDCVYVMTPYDFWKCPYSQSSLKERLGDLMESYEISFSNELKRLAA